MGGFFIYFRYNYRLSPPILPHYVMPSLPHCLSRHAPLLVDGGVQYYPAQDFVYLSNAEGAELSIQNYLGQTLQRFIITSKKEQIKIHDLATGLYQMQIKHADGRQELLHWRKE